MRKDLNHPQGTVHSLWIDGESLKGNLLQDPTLRRIDVYVPAGHDGRGLPLLVDLVGFTAGGPAHTNWKNYGERTELRAETMIERCRSTPAAITTRRSDRVFSLACKIRRTWAQPKLHLTRLCGSLSPLLKRSRPQPKWLELAQ